MLAKQTFASLSHWQSLQLEAPSQRPAWLPECCPGQCQAWEMYASNHSFPRLRPARDLGNRPTKARWWVLLWPVFVPSHCQYCQVALQWNSESSSWWCSQAQSWQSLSLVGDSVCDLMSKSCVLNRFDRAIRCAPEAIWNLDSDASELTFQACEFMGFYMDPVHMTSDVLWIYCLSFILIWFNQLQNKQMNSYVTQNEKQFYLHVIWTMNSCK
jgi:hypothetical protein